MTKANKKIECIRIVVLYSKDVFVGVRVLDNLAPRLLIEVEEYTCEFQIVNALLDTARLAFFRADQIEGPQLIRTNAIYARGCMATIPVMIVPPKEKTA